MESILSFLHFKLSSMESILSSITSIQIFISLFILLCLSKIFLKKSTTKKTPPPPPPPPPQATGSWPVIGHLLLLGDKKPAHQTLSQMAEKHGPIFTIMLGQHRAIVVSSSDVAKQCFTTNDKSFANRPKTLASEIMCYDYTMFGFSHYGSYWRQARKFTTLELLSNHRLRTLRHVRESEIELSCKELYRFWLNGNKTGSENNEAAKVEMKKWFGEVTLNVILRMVVGKRFTSTASFNEKETDLDSGSGSGWRKALKDFFDLTGRFVLSDALPFLRWMDIGGDEKLMKKVMKELDDVVGGWLDEHKEKRFLSGEVKVDEDFMDVMLTSLDGTDELSKFTDATTFNKAITLGSILASSDTTTVTLSWCLSLLLNNPTTLKKAQHEVDTHIGKERRAEESDMKNLVYIEAIIKETMRLYPAAPLLLPHESLEDCTVNGYHIPKGTRLIVNASKIQRDPNVWSDPNEFRPERFLETHKDVDVRGQNFELIPFGSGRRMCPGISFALQVLQLTLASLIHGFEISTPSNEPIDMSEGTGLTNLKVTPLHVLLAPRLPAHLY